jgi:hypothetical protein
MSPDFLRYFLIFVGIVALMRWSRGGGRWRRNWNTGRPGPLKSSEELGAIENRLSLVERLESRVEELENRLDFTERLLSRKSAGSD